MSKTSKYSTFFAIGNKWKMTYNIFYQKQRRKEWKVNIITMKNY